MPQITRKPRNLIAPPPPSTPLWAWGDGPVMGLHDEPDMTVDSGLGRITLHRGPDGRLVGGIEPRKPK